MDHPFGQSGDQREQRFEDGSSIIVNADGSQSLRRSDGRVEQVDGSRGIGGDTDRSLGSDMAVCLPMLRADSENLDLC